MAGIFAFFLLGSICEMLEESYYLASQRKASETFFPDFKNATDIWN